MILHGNQRGGAKNLALHLTNDENESITVHDVRGFVSRDVMGALIESYALSRATKCKQHLYSLSLNPPKDVSVSDEEFVQAVEQTEERLGLSGQPRVIVLHEKYGSDGQLRKHAHAVWSRIDTKRMKAVQLSYTRRKLQDVSRELYIRHGWKMPHGFVNPYGRDPRNFTLAEWQQAKRQGKDPKTLKAMFQERWSVSDGLAGFSQALKGQGFVLAKGDRRGFVAVDHTGEAYAISRWVGVKTKAVTDKLGSPESMPSVHDAQAEAAAMVAGRLQVLRDLQQAKLKRFQKAYERRKANIQARKQRAETALSASQQSRLQEEDTIRAARIRKGLLGLLDRLTGRRRKMEALNRQERYAATKRDVSERALQAEKYRAKAQQAEKQSADRTAQIDRSSRELEKDIKWLKKPLELASSETLSAMRPRLSHSKNDTGTEPEI